MPESLLTDLEWGFASIRRRRVRLKTGDGHTRFSFRRLPLFWELRARFTFGEFRTILRAI